MAELQDTVLNAVSTMIDNAISALKVDKTITATIISCNNAVTGEYILSYNGGRITAYVTNTSTTYNKNQCVHVLVPSGELSARKTIIGVAENIGSDNNLTSTAALIDNYNLLGSNLVSVSGTQYYPKGIKSGSSSIVDKTQVLYDSNDNTVEQLRYSDSMAQNNLDQAERLLIQASFRTNLSSLHQYESKGEYGLTIGIALKDNTYSRNKYDAIASDLYDENYFTNACAEFRKKLDDIVKNVNGYTSSDAYWNNALAAYISFYEVVSNINSIDNTCGIAYDGEINKYDFESGSFPAASVDNIKYIGINNFSKILDIAEGQKVDGEVIKYCTLSSIDMIGDPKAFYTYSPQYNIYELDAENFIRIDSITFNCDGFTEEVSPKNDIFIKDVKIYFLKEITAVNGDFKLKISQPDGNVFTTQSSAEQVPVELKLLYKNNVVNSEAGFYWYKKNSLVTKDSLDYEYHGGTGWSYLGTKYSSDNCYFLASDNLAYKNEYKVVAVHDATTTLSDTFILYNESAEKEVTIESDLGDTFYFDEQDPVLTCLVVPEVSANDKIKYVWNKTDDNYQTRTDYTQSVDDLIEERDAKLKELGSNAGSTAIKRTYAAQIEEASKITFLTTNNGKQVANSQQIKYSLKDITSTTITLGCTIFILPNGIETNQYEAGSASIILTNKKKGSSVDYNIEIDNDSQFFQYTESGVSPAAESQGDDAITPKELSCKFYSPNGMEMATGAYTVKWEVPVTNTLIDSSELTLDMSDFNEYNQTKYIYNSYTFPLKIADTYDYAATNNQIKCVVTYAGEEYYKYTNLTFLKVGENGTNGTDVSVKILPTGGAGRIDNVYNGIEPLCAVCDIYSQTETEAYYHLRWNSGQGFNENVVKAQIFQKNEDITSEALSWTWSVAGGDSKNRMVPTLYEIDEETQADQATRGILQLSPASGETNSLVLKACAELYKTTQAATEENESTGNELADSIAEAKEKQSYYAFLPIPIIAYSNNGTEDATKAERAATAPYVGPIRVAIDKQQTLQSILYDASGLNPQYDTNKGVAINIYPNYNYDTPSGGWVNYLNDIKLEFYCVGGKGYNTDLNTKDGYTPASSATAAFWVYKTQDEARVSDDNTNRNEEVIIEGGEATEDATYLSKKVYVRPNDMYSGKYTNNAVIVMISKKSTVERLALVEIPIHLSLNTHSLASLNSWDGNSVQINEDDEYILAPQIGAGYKTTVTTDETLNNTTNVFTGIVMGTKEENGATKAGLYGYNKGRQCIELDAETGSAIFGLSESAASAENNWQNGRIELIPDGASKIGNWVIGANSLYNIKWTRDFYTSADTPPSLAGDGDIPFEMMETNNLTNAKYKNVLGSQTSGILISSDPSFFSAKGATLSDKDDNPLDFDSGNSEVSPGDSLEIAIDPNQNSIFTMYQHTNTADTTNVETDQPFICYGGETTDGSQQIWYILKRTCNFGNTFSSELSESLTEASEDYRKNIESNYSDYIYTKVYVPNITKQTSQTKYERGKIEKFEFFNPINTDNGVNQYYIATLRTVQSSYDDEYTKSVRIYDVDSDNDRFIRRRSFRIRTVNGLDNITKNLKEVADVTSSVNEKTLYTFEDLKDYLVWRKIPRVGIESNGRFYTNALKDQSTSMSMGKVSAFGHDISNAKYFGTNFEISNLSDSETKQYFKIFIPKSSVQQNMDYFEEDNPVILSGGSNTDNEYARPMEIYGKTLKIFAAGDGNEELKKARYNEYELSLGDNDAAHFGYTHFDFSENNSLIKNDGIGSGETTNIDTVTWPKSTKMMSNSSFLDLYHDSTSGTAVNQSNNFTRWTTTEITEDERIDTDNTQSGLFVGNTPFKFWNYSAGTGFYTNNFIHTTGASFTNWNPASQTAEFNQLNVYHSNIGETDSDVYRVGAKGDLSLGTANNLYEAYRGSTMLNAHIIGNVDGAKNTRRYDYGLWIDSTSGGRNLPCGTPWQTTDENQKSLLGRSYVLGDFIPHDERIISDKDSETNAKPIKNSFSLLELNSNNISYLYAGNGFVLHSKNNNVPGDNTLGGRAGTNTNENFGDSYWSSEDQGVHMGVDIISDTAPIMLSAVGSGYKAGGDGLNYFFLEHGSTSAQSLQYKDGENKGAMSWEIQGDYGTISARAFACAELSSKSGTPFNGDYAKTTHGVFIDPGIVSPSGLFLDTLETNRMSTDSNGWENMAWKEYSIYAQNGLYSKAKIWADDCINAVNNITIGPGGDGNDAIGLYNNDGVGFISVKGDINAIGNVSATGNVFAEGDVTANGTTLQTHTHSFSGTVQTTAPSYEISVDAESIEDAVSQNGTTYNQYTVSFTQSSSSGTVGDGHQCTVYVPSGQDSTTFTQYVVAKDYDRGVRIENETEMYSKATVSGMEYTVPEKTFTAYIEGETNQANGEGNGYVTCTLSK